MANFKITKNYNNRIYVLTKKYQKIYGFKIGTGRDETHNNESDAFKHTFMQADLALKYGDVISKIAGDYHEYSPRKNPQDEKNMDLWNNHQGRQIAKDIKKEYGDAFYNLSETVQDDIIADKVVQKMRKGELITNPSDKRKYTGYAADINGIQKSDNIKESEYYRKTGKHSPIRMQSDGVYGEKCSGSYPVSGYTRGDNTKVSSYVRKCHKHGGSLPKLNNLSKEEIDYWVAKFI